MRKRGHCTGALVQDLFGKLAQEDAVLDYVSVIDGVNLPHGSRFATSARVHRLVEGDQRLTYYHGVSKRNWRSNKHVMPVPWMMMSLFGSSLL
jgi:hypothetical protein